MTKNGTELIDYLSRLWNCHINNVFLPRSTSHDLFITCLAYLFSRSPNLIEYGPFIGHTSFYLVSLASVRGGESYLVDDWRQMTQGHLITPDAAKRILEANVGSIPTNRYDLVDRNVLDDPIINVDAGFIFYDICVDGQCAVAAQSMIDHRAALGKETIVVVDDSVHLHETNGQFLETWVDLYPKLPMEFKPFLVTKNRLFMANFAVDKAFNDLISVLTVSGWLTVSGSSHNLYGLPIYGSPGRKSIGKTNWDFLSLMLKDLPISV